MCRFLILRSKEKKDVKELLEQFSGMCEASRAPDGDLQADGWGVAWNRNGAWEVYTSLSPIWDDTTSFEKVPDTQFLAIHARSAGFPNQKGILEYNQPYLSDTSCFVFNGRISGVKIQRQLQGKIGAQKLFSLLQEEMKEKSAEGALRAMDSIVMENSRQVHGMNIGVIHDKILYGLCEYTESPDYFGLQYYSDENISLICSERIGEFQWQTMGKGEIIKI